MLGRSPGKLIGDDGRSGRFWPGSSTSGSSPGKSITLLLDGDSGDVVCSGHFGDLFIDDGLIELN